MGKFMDGDRTEYGIVRPGGIDWQAEEVPLGDVGPDQELLVVTGDGSTSEAFWLVLDVSLPGDMSRYTLMGVREEEIGDLLGAVAKLKRWLEGVMRGGGG